MTDTRIAPPKSGTLLKGGVVAGLVSAIAVAAFLFYVLAQAVRGMAGY